MIKMSCEADPRDTFHIALGTLLNAKGDFVLLNMESLINTRQ